MTTFEDTGPSKEILYSQLPLLTPDVLPDGIKIIGKPKGSYSFAPFMTQEDEVFYKAIAGALKEPDWAAVLEDTESGNGFLRHPKVSLTTLDQVGSKTARQLIELAHGINSRNIFGDEGSNIVVRAFEIMAKQYPNLAFLRGHNFDPNEGIWGYDYSWGDLPDALGFAMRQEYPVVAMLPFKVLVQGYKDHELGISTEGDYWSRNSLEVHMAPPVKRNLLQVFKVPVAPRDIGLLNTAFEQKVIK